LEQNISLKAYSRLTSLDTPSLLWNTIIHYRVHKSLPLAPYPELAESSQHTRKHIPPSPSRHFPKGEPWPLRASLEAAEKPGNIKDVELILILKGHLILQTYNLVEKVLHISLTFY
jgi:hypothetical protein